MTEEGREAEAVSRDATTTVSTALRRVVEEQHRRVLEAWPAASTGDAAALRLVRIASRRLREALAVAERVCPGRQPSRARREMRRMTRALGPLREIEVTIERFAEASRQHGWAESRVGAVRRRLQKQQRTRRHEVARWMREADLEGLSRRLTAVAEGLSAANPDAIEQRLLTRIMSRARQVRRAAMRCGTLYAPDRLHRMRVAIKKLRYATELGVSAGHPALEPAVKALTRVQRRLGVLHDVEMLHHEARTVARGESVAARAAGELVGDALERDCRTLHARVVAELSRLDAALADIRRVVASSADAGRTMLAVGTPPRIARRRAAG